MKTLIGKMGLSAKHNTALRAGIGRALCACITLAFAGINATASAAGPVTITSAGGYSDGFGVASGRWTGQPSYAPRTASNAYYDYAVIESQNNGYYWDIYGTNFGTTVGSVWVLDSNLQPLTNVKMTYVSWTDTKIRVIPRGTDANFRYSRGAYLAVSLDKTVPNQSNVRNAIRSFPVVGIIQSRGYGQCTWYVANKRLSAGKAIPPTAYATNVGIAAAGSSETGYVPERWDALNFGGKHVGIITTTPVKTVRADGSISWAFTVGEMNATWNEAESTSARTYALSAADANGKRKVVSGIGCNAGYIATACYK